MLDEIVGIIAYRNPDHLIWVAPLLLLTFGLIWYLKGRVWAMVYLALIPFLNWTFGQADKIMQPVPFIEDALFNPITILTGLVFVVRDFAQREMGHRVLIVMVLAIGWSFYYAFPPIALASAAAYAISETVDWSLFTFTRIRLSSRVLLSSALAAPLDTVVFLYGASFTDPAQFSFWNAIFMVIGKMIGAVVIFYGLRVREARGEFAAALHGPRHGPGAAAS
ncbi:MAG: VUT family protein [Pseudomonadota bacterium]